MKEYETVFILRSQTPEKEIKEFEDRLQKLVSGQKGKIFFFRFLGKKSLSYPIEKQREGIYIHCDYASESSCVQEWERNLKLDERVLRFLTIVLQKGVDVDKRVQELAQAESAAPTLP